MTLDSTYVPSANKAIRGGCPDRLAVAATLFGLSPAPPERCRMLELGCAEGAHLIPLAGLAPDSRYLGVDLDAEAVRRGNETVAALGLGNVRLECVDFRELAARGERFDYVVAHGVYSWVPPGVRDALLSLVEAVLAENGVGYLSFHLAETNESVGLGAFVEHLGRHGLEYVTDADTLDCSALLAHPSVVALETRFASPIERLEYVDRLDMRRFRQAVVCRKGAAGELDFAKGRALWFASSAEPAARGAVRGSGPVRFKTVAGVELETTVPELKLALYELGRVWPAALRADDLSERVAEHLGVPAKPDDMVRLLLDSGASVVVRAFARAPRSVHAASEKPVATPLARLEASRGSDVTNLHHEPVQVDVAFHRRLLELLDGSRDRAGLARELSDAIEAGGLVVPGIDAGARSRWEALIPREVGAGLERLCRYGLLLS